MASLRERTNKKGQTAYYVLWREHGTQTSKPFPTRSDAEFFMKFLNANNQSFAAAAKVAKQAVASGPSVADALELHFKGRTGIEERTREDYRREVRLHINPTLGAVKVKALTRADVRDWVNAMAADGAAPKSISNRHGILSAAMATAVEEGLREDNPCKGVRLPEKNRVNEREVFLEPEDYALLLAQFPEKWKPVAQLLAGTGLRWGEATALQVADAVLDAKVPYLIIDKAWKRGVDHRNYLDRPKTRRSFREVTIDDGLVEALRPLVDGRPAEAFILTAARGETPLTYRNYQGRVWAPAVTRAMERREDNPRPLRHRPKIHHLRHSHGSWLLMEGVDIMAVSRRLGHENVQTTINIYGHVSQRAKREAADAIGRALGAPKPKKGKKGKKKAAPE